MILIDMVLAKLPTEEKGYHGYKTIFIFILALSIYVFFMPNILGDSENYVMANPMQTPPAIVPE